MKKGTLIVVFGFWFAHVKGQNPVTDFTLPTNACLNQNILIQNLSTNASSYEWDFCQGDLSLPPTATLALNLNGNVTTGIDVVFDGLNWYGFVTNQNGNSILRLNFGSDIYSTPSITDLGNVDGNIANPTDIKILGENGNWYGFVYCLSGSLITRINFGNSLSNTSTTPIPISSEVIVNGAGSTNGGFDMIFDGNDWVIVLTKNSSLSCVRLSTLAYNPSASDIIANIPDVYANTLGDVVLKKYNNNFYGYTVAFGNNTLQRLTFGSSVFTTPTIDDLSGVLPNGFALYGIDCGFDNGHYYLFISALSGDLIKVDLGPDLSSSPISGVSLGNFSVLENTLKIKLLSTQSHWVAFSPSWLSTNLYRIDFPNPSACSSNTIFSTVKNPKLKYLLPGTQYVTLKSYGNNQMDELSKSIIVSSTTAPDINFLSTGICVNNPSDFTIVNSSNNLNSFVWDFDDGNTSTSSDPSHIYATASIYYPSLTVTASNGCQNFTQDTIQIFNSPQANFNLPSASPFCSNQNYSFVNTSTFDIGSNPTWQWNVNGTNVATTQDLSYLIPSTTAQNITLTAFIPGCSSQSTQSITTVQDGPLANFSSPNTGCVDTSIPFTNTTSGTVTGYAWTFGDGNSSSQTNAANTYSSSGNFAVTLTAYNVAGCQNFLSKNISIYSNPQPDFAIEAPPYSCANYPAQFDNNTLPLSDSNITTWAWNFGDPSNGTSNQKNPSYTYSTATTYNVTLQAISNFGCTGTKQHNVIIYPSPQSAFTNSPACVNQNTQFKDASSGSITAYQWVVQGTILTGANPPPYVFKSAGTFPVSLTTTLNNGCKNQVVKNIAVPVPPIMDFTFQPPCTGKPTAFQEANPGGSDPSIAWNWNFGSGSGTGSPTDYTFTGAGGYTVTLSATRTSGCIYSTSKNITIYDGPVAKFTPSEQAGAAPLSVTFNNESKADSYFWEFDFNNSTSDEVSPVFTYTELGEYKVLLIASNIHGCIDTVSTKIYVVIPRVDLAMKNFSLVEDPSSNSSKPVVTILNLGNIQLTNPEVQIDLGGNVRLKEKITSTILPGKSIQQTLSLEIVPQSLGYICAEVAPTGDVNIHNDRQCLSLTDNDVLFYPYPNPAKGQINFDWISSENENVAVTIFKSTGQVAFQQNFQTVQSGINQLAIDISSLSSGLYLIQFSGVKAKKTFSISVIN